MARWSEPQSAFGIGANVPGSSPNLRSRPLALNRLRLTKPPQSCVAAVVDARWRRGSICRKLRAHAIHPGGAGCRPRHLEQPGNADAARGPDVIDGPAERRSLGRERWELRRAAREQHVVQRGETRAERRQRGRRPEGRRVLGVVARHAPLRARGGEGCALCWCLLARQGVKDSQGMCSEGWADKAGSSTCERTVQTPLSWGGGVPARAPAPDFSIKPRARSLRNSTWRARHTWSVRERPSRLGVNSFQPIACSDAHAGL
jgi:hypothetical protein